MKKRLAFNVVFILIFMFFGSASWGLDEIVEKKTFTLEELTLISGKKLAPVKIGYETYGTLASTKDNVILICHYYSGNSHAAGKYAATDKVPGYWDKIIGPGKPFDTTKYFIVSSDTLSNMNPKNPKVITTGPASNDPKTGKPYGMSFPMVTIRDFVNLQYELLKSLGVKKLQVVSGASMGGIQSYEWAVAYPDFVERIIPVIAAPKADGWLIGWLKLWDEPIRMDPNWNNGDYYGKEEPVAGKTYSLALITLSALWSDWADQLYARKWADSQKSPYEAMDNVFLADAALFKRAAGRSQMADANSMLYLNKANALFDISHGFDSYEAALQSIKAKVLMVGADTDILFTATQLKQHFDAFQKAGLDVSFFELKTGFGHLGGVLDISQASETITKFLGE